MSKYNSPIIIRQYDIQNYIDELAWKKIGFKDRDDVLAQVEAMSFEEKIGLLSQVFLEEMAKQHADNKIKFLRTLGASTGVSPDEAYKYAKKIYTGKRFKVNFSDFHYWYVVDPEALHPRMRNSDPDVK